MGRMPHPVDILRVVSRHSGQPDGDLSTSGLARVSGWSSAHFHRAFVRATTETPKRWATRVRLAHAIELLCDTELPIDRVAQQCGYADHAQLGRVMRRTLDTTPAAVRRAGSGSHVHHALCLALYHLRFTPREVSMPDVTLQERPAQPVVFQRVEVVATEVQRALAQCLPAVFAHCQREGLTMVGPPYTRYVSMRPGRMTLEAGMQVQVARGDDGAQILAGELPAGPTAVTTHEGAYDSLQEAHVALEQWAEGQGRAAAGGPWEIYVTDPGDHPDPADWRTEVCLPLTPA